jgi:Flp pilus assembly protein TadG
MGLAVIDLSRAIFDKEVLSDLARTGSNLASRGATLSAAANAVITEPSALNMASNGLAIVTAVTNNSGAITITGQAQAGGITGSSKVGVLGANAILPATNPPIPSNGQTVYVTEVFYAFAPITPIGNFISIAFPSTLYDVAYF